MKFQSMFASVRSFRLVSVALPLAALLCAAPLTRAARADATPRIYLFDPVFGITDVTSTYDGSSVVSLTGEVIYVTFVDPEDLTTAGGHTTDLTTAGGHTTDLTTAGGHTTDLVLDDTNSVVGVVGP